MINNHGLLCLSHSFKISLNQKHDILNLENKLFSVLKKLCSMFVYNLIIFSHNDY